MSGKTSTNVILEQDGTIVAFDVANTEITREDFQKLELKTIGLNEADYDEVVKTANSIDINDSSSINKFGSSLGTASKDSTNKLLEMVNAKDLDQTGRQIKQILVLAQDTNLDGLGKGRLRKLPVVGKLIGMISNSGRSISNGLQNTDQLLDSIVAEIEENQKGLDERIGNLDTMHENVIQEYHQLGVCIASGKIITQKIDDAIDLLSKEDMTDQLIIQKLNDLTNTRNRLDKRVSDLYLLQQSCLQTLPQIRIIQNNSLALIDKFHSIQAVTLPAWRNQISLTLSLEEQQRSVKLTQAIDDTTNDLLKRNAALLRQNSIETARSNQRSVIDVETLKTVQQELIATVKETSLIAEEGRVMRLTAQKELAKLQQDLNSQVLSEAVNSQQIEMKSAARN